MMPKSPFKVAWVECEPLSQNQLHESLVLPYFLCTSFTTDNEFRLSFCEIQFDAVLYVCESCSKPQTRAIVEWVRSVRCSSVPVMVLCEHNDESEIAKILYAGADDVQTLPVKPNVIRARVTALCARTSLARSTANRVIRQDNRSQRW